MKKIATMMCMVFLFISLMFFQNCAGKKDSSADLSSSLASTINHASKEIIIKMNNEDSYQKMVAWVNNTQSDISYEWPEDNMAVISWQGEITVANMLYTVSLSDFSKAIDFVEPNYILSAPLKLLDHPPEVKAGGFDESTTSFSRAEINILPLSAQNQTVNALMGVSNIQGRGDANKPVVVAVLDSGLDINHSYYVQSQSLWENSREVPGDNIDNDGNGLVDDVHGWNFMKGSSDVNDTLGYGTLNAGAVLNISSNIFTNNPSVSPVKIMPLKVIGVNGIGKVSDAIKAINYAVSKGAKVLNNSWATSERSSALYYSLVNASNEGLFIVAASGNDSSNNDAKPVYPSSESIPNLISVAASTDNDVLGDFSNYGRQSVSMAAPGVRILSTFPNLNNVDRYGFFSGTGTATSLIAGAAAIILNANSELTGYELKKILLSTAEPISEFQGFLKEASRVNVERAVASAMEVSSQTEQPQAVAVISQSNNFEAEDVDSLTGCGLVKSGNGPDNPLPISLLLLVLPVLLMRKLRYNLSPCGI